MIKRPTASILLLVVLSAYLFLFQLGGLALTDPDETFYAQTAKEMLNGNEWHTPYLYGVPQFEKPIVIYWLVEASYRVFGVNEFAARFPSAVFGIIGIVAIYLLGSLLFNRRVGVLSAVMLAASVEYTILSRACVTDMTLSTFMLLGVLFFFYGYMRAKQHCYLLSSAAFAMATLTKGPIAIMLALASLLFYLLLIGDMRALKKMPLFWCAASFLIVAMPWYMLMYRLYGMTFVEAFFGFHNVTRFLKAEHAIGSQFYYNIPIVFGGFFPWSVFLPVGFWNLFKKSLSKEKSARSAPLFVLAWFFVIFIFFSVSSTKLPTYVFPSFISLALIVAVFWDDFLKERANGGLMKKMAFSYYLMVIVIVGGAIGIFIYLRTGRYAPLQGGVAVSSLFLILGMALSLAAFIGRKFLTSFFFIIYGLIIFVYPMSKLILPQIELYETSKDISRRLLLVMKPDEALGCESNYRAGLAFYTGRYPTDVDKHHILVQFLTSDKRVWCVMKDKNHRELYELDTKPYYTRPSYMIYRIGKRAIVTNKRPEDGKYLLKRERVK